MMAWQPPGKSVATSHNGRLDLRKTDDRKLPWVVVDLQDGVKIYFSDSKAKAMHAMHRLAAEPYYTTDAEREQRVQLQERALRMQDAAREHARQIAAGEIVRGPVIAGVQMWRKPNPSRLGRLVAHASMPALAVGVRALGGPEASRRLSRGFQAAGMPAKWADRLSARAVGDVSPSKRKANPSRMTEAERRQFRKEVDEFTQRRERMRDHWWQQRQAAETPRSPRRNPPRKPKADFSIGPGWREYSRDSRETVYLNQSIRAVIRVRHLSYQQHRPVLLEREGRATRDFQWVADAVRAAGEG